MMHIEVVKIIRNCVRFAVEKNDPSGVDVIHFMVEIFKLERY
jgi:hypothetical protein